MTIQADERPINDLQAALETALAINPRMQEMSALVRLLARAEDGEKFGRLLHNALAYASTIGAQVVLDELRK